MVTACIKTRYFPESDFLNAELGPNPNYTRRNILVDQEVLKTRC